MRSKGLLLVLPLAAVSVACRQDMHNQPKYKPLAESEFFADHRSARPAIDGTVARGHLRTDLARYTGKNGTADIDSFPIPIAKADILRGRERFNIYCTPCHGQLGDGNGMIVKRGFRQPPSYHTDRLRTAPVGHFFDVVTNGYGAMPSYASRVAPDDRWRIIAYIRALQFSQNGAVNDVPAEGRAQLEAQTQQQPPPVTNGPPANPAPPSNLVVPESGAGTSGSKPGRAGQTPAANPGSAKSAPNQPEGKQ